MAVYKTQSSSFVISSRRVWRPGAYADRRAAQYAFRFSDEVLSKLRDQINLLADQGGEGRNITLDDLRKKARELKEKDREKR